MIAGSVCHGVVWMRISGLPPVHIHYLGSIPGPQCSSDLPRAPDRDLRPPPQGSHTVGINARCNEEIYTFICHELTEAQRS